MDFSVIAIAVFTILNLWGQYKSGRRKEISAEAEDLIKILQGTVDALETKTKKLEEDSHARNETMAAVSKENEVLTKILQGRDTTTLEFQRQGIEAFALMKSTHEIMLRSHEESMKMSSNIEKFLGILAKQNGSTI
jgi:hypothetical protein